MNINITNESVPLEMFKKWFSSTTNIKDVHLLCHQADCPVYIVRDINNKCAVLWHPCMDKNKNVINVVIINKVLKLQYNNEPYLFVDIEVLKNESLAKHMLGDNPFKDNNCVWKRGLE